MEEQTTKTPAYTELRPANVFDVAANETWLEDMAAQGWRLTGFTGWSGVFEKDEPKACRYRMSPLPKKEKAPEPELVEAYRAMGWEYAATIKGVFHVWRCDDPAAPELDTDPVVQGLGYGYLKRRMAWDRAASLLLAAGLLVLAVLLPLAYDTPLLDLIEDNAPGEWLLRLTAGTLCLVILFCQVRAMGRLSKALKAGFPLKRPRPYRRQKRLARAAWGSWVLLMALLVLGDFPAIDGGSLERGWRASDRRGDPKPGVVYVDLRELESAEGETIFWSCRTKIQELCPRMYDVMQTVGEEENFSEADTQYYRMLTPGLARELAKELAAERSASLGVVYGHGELLPQPVSQLDEFWWGGALTDKQFAVARLGRQVLAVAYRGPTDLRTAQGYLAELLAAT